jgi:DNA topoisomerase IB
MLTRTGKKSPTKNISNALNLWSFRRRGNTCGFRRLRRAVCRQSEWTRPDAVQYLYHSKFSENSSRKNSPKSRNSASICRNCAQRQRAFKSGRLSARKGFSRDAAPDKLAVHRIGTEKSVKHYKTYGITTLQNRHLQIGKKGELVFDFVGKHHIKHRKVLVDEELCAIMNDLKNIGGARKLFHYWTKTASPAPIKPKEVNDYLKTATSVSFPRKIFALGGGTLLRL